MSDPLDDSAYYEGRVNSEAITHHSGYGAPATLLQSDVLARVGHMLTARSDTFKIRAHGLARDRSGNITSKAWCEAVVQRIPDYVNPSDDAATPPNRWELDSNEIEGQWSESGALSELSQRFGRRFKIISFRWLSESEI